MGLARRAVLSALALAALVIVAPAAASAITFSNVQTLAGAASGVEFGGAVAISGNTMVVGAPNDEDGGAYQYGAVLVYTQTSPGDWTLQTTLDDPDYGEFHSDHFGSSVAIDPDGTIVAGAPNAWMDVDSTQTETGAAWVFTPNGSGGYGSQELTGSTMPDALFGEAVAIQGDTVVAGAPQDSADDNDEHLYGAAYVFMQPGADESFSLASEVQAPEQQNEDLFGNAVAISGTTILVGAPDYDSDAGSVFSYAEASASDDWSSEDLTETELDGASNALFGSALAVSTSEVYSGGTFASTSTTLVVGAPGTPESDTEDVGAGFVYGLPSDGDLTSLSDETELQPSDTDDATPGYGSAVAIDGATIALQPDTFGFETYAYSEPTDGWSSDATATALEPTSPSAPLGEGGVAVSGNVLASGAPDPSSTGFVYVFDQPATTVQVDLSPSSIPADGASTATATAYVTDSAGDPVTDDDVTFTAGDGVGVSSVTNNGDGTYTVTLTASTTADADITITATDTTASSNPSGTATLVLTPTIVDETLTVMTAGSGSGTVTSNDDSIDCPGSCSETVDQGTQITLTETPNAGSTFTGWSGGGCSGTSTTCVVTLSEGETVTATFELIPNETLTVGFTGAGLGTLTSNDGVISCPYSCTDSVLQGTLITLTETPSAGSVFTGWSGGGCSGSSTTCIVTLSQAQTVLATFARPTTAQIKTDLKPTLTISGGGATSKSLLKHGDYKLSFQPPSTGKLTIDWRYQASARSKTTLVASLKATIQSIGKRSLEIKLSAAGKALLRTHKQLKLKITTTFTPTGGKATTETKTVTIK